MIQKPMIRTDNKLVKKEAPELFKLIQTYMGDRKMSRDAPPSSLLVDVIMKGWRACVNYVMNSSFRSADRRQETHEST